MNLIDNYMSHHESIHLYSDATILNAIYFQIILFINLI